MRRVLLRTVDHAKGVNTHCGEGELFGSSDGLNLPNIDVYGHITLNTPVLVRSLKLSKVELC